MWLTCKTPANSCSVQAWPFLRARPGNRRLMIRPCRRLMSTFIPAVLAALENSFKAANSLCRNSVPVPVDNPQTSLWTALTGTTFSWKHSPYENSWQCVLWIIRGNWDTVSGKIKKHVSFFSNLDEPTPVQFLSHLVRGHLRTRPDVHQLSESFHASSSRLLKSVLVNAGNRYLKLWWTEGMKEKQKVNETVSPQKKRCNSRASDSQQKLTGSSLWVWLFNAEINTNGVI